MSDGTRPRPHQHLQHASSPRRPIAPDRLRRPRRSPNHLTADECIVLPTRLAPGEHVENVLRVGNEQAWRTWAATNRRILMLERSPHAFRAEEVPLWGLSAMELEPTGGLAVLRLWALGRRHTMAGVGLADARVFESAVRLRSAAPIRDAAS